MIVDNEGKIFENRRKNKDRRKETVKTEENRRKQERRQKEQKETNQRTKRK